MVGELRGKGCHWTIAAMSEHVMPRNHEGLGKGVRRSQALLGTRLN